MHLHVANAEAVAVEVEDDLAGVLGEQGHRNRAVGDLLGDHERAQALAERIVMMAGMPDGDFFGFPGFLRADGDCRGRDVLDGGSSLLTPPSHSISDLRASLLHGASSPVSPGFHLSLCAPTFPSVPCNQSKTPPKRGFWVEREG